MISNKTKYALKALARLAEEYPKDRPVLIAELAAKERIPKKFLELILLELKNKGILQSKKGKGGGYLLAKSPEQINLGGVLRILEGPIAPLPCLSKTAYHKCDDCVDETTCSVRFFLRPAYEATLNVLENTNLQDVIDQVKGTKIAEMYQI